MVFIGHSTLKYLLSNKDTKARPIPWILLLQEFNFQIKDEQGIEKVVIDHLSRVKIDLAFHRTQINGTFFL